MCPCKCPRPALAILCLTTLLGCSPTGGELRLAEPGEGEPKSVVDFHVEYASRPGDHSKDKVFYDGLDVGTGKHTLFPQSGRVTVSTAFWHEEVHSEWQNVPVTRYESSSESVRDSCASTDAHGHCESGYTHQTVTKAVTRYERQQVSVTREIPDGSCTTESTFRFAKDRRYRVNYRFIAAAQCELTCVDDAGDRCGVPAPTEPVAAPVRDRRVAHPLRAVGIAVTTVGAAGVLVGLGTGLAAGSQKPTIREHCDVAKTCDEEGLAAASKGRDYAIASTISLLAGGAILVGGVVLMNLPSTWKRVQVGANGLGSLFVSGQF